ncbi:MAG: chemotaxis response regulator protein-glutamate methylesterase [bacterium]|nr:MAG: chemotaxis response regulator protein-glutamate methylesterase [bacterium]
MEKKIKVLVVDDSALVRKIFSDIVNEDPSLELVGIAQNGVIALRKIQELNPDIVTLDVEMPELDGFGVLKAMVGKRLQSKVIMVSGVTKEGAESTLKALEMGALDFIPKPSGRMNDLKVLSESLLAKIHAIAHIDMAQITRRVYKSYEPPQTKLEPGISGVIPRRIVAIGTSTGGPQALKDVFHDEALPGDCAYLVVQHMPGEFTRPFSERLNEISKLNVKEAEHGEKILSGWVYIAPGHSHLEINYRQRQPYAKLSQSGKVSGHQPSIDVLFMSVAKNCGKDVVAVIMTGMGRDGSKGIKTIQEMGGYTIAQDKESSIVFGMNREAIDIGAINDVVPLREIPTAIQSILYTKR